MSGEQKRAVLALRLTAALAEKLADDLEGNRLWEREYGEGVAQIHKALRDLPSLP